MVGAGRPLGGQVALVTGAGRGLGRAFAERLAALGAAIGVHGMREHGPAAVAPNPIPTGYEGRVRDQIDHYIQRVRGREMGMLPALGGLVVLSLLFWAATPFFFTKTNIANLLTQTAALMMLAVVLLHVWRQQSRYIVDRNAERQTASTTA